MSNNTINTTAAELTFDGPEEKKGFKLPSINWKVKGMAYAILFALAIEGGFSLWSKGMATQAEFKAKAPAITKVMKSSVKEAIRIIKL